MEEHEAEGERMMDGNPEITFLNEEYKEGRLTRAEYEQAVREEMARGYHESGDEYGMRVLPTRVHDGDDDE